MFRKIFLPLVLLAGFMFGGSISSKAQVTVLHTYTYAFYGAVCELPYSYMLDVYGDMEGTSVPTDSFTIYVDFQDGTDTSFNIPVGLDTTTFSNFFTSFYHTYTIPGTYLPFVTVTSPSMADTPNIIAITINDTCGNLEGFLYVDEDGDCVHDSTETPVTSIYVTATNNTTGAVYYGYTTDGSYSITVPYGFIYTVACSAYGAGISAACPAGASALVDISGTGTFTQDFGFACGGGNPDLSVHAWATNMHPGIIRMLHVAGLSNEFCDSSAATVTLTLPSLLTYSSTSSGMAPTSVSGSTLTWDVDSLSALNEFISNLWIYCDSTAVLGDSACITATIAPVSGTDPDLSNNTYSVCIPINLAMDPNDKSVAPKGSGPEGYIPLSTTSLSYFIEFQNTGTDTAYNVTISDQLDVSIDPASLHVISASGNYVTSVTTGGLVKFRFNDIRLPDSNVNEPLSHGYILYEVNLKPGLAEGTVIQNTAEIYFDYNAAVVTNTTMNTLGNPAGVQQLEQGNIKAIVSPNPANNLLNIVVTGANTYSVTLRDMTGRIISVQQGTGSSVMNTSTVAEGLYLLEIQSGAARLSTKVLVNH